MIYRIKCNKVYFNLLIKQKKIVEVIKQNKNIINIKNIIKYIKILNIANSCINK